MKLVRNWLSLPPSSQSTTVVLAVVALLAVVAQASWQLPSFGDRLPVSGHAVFIDGEWWRLWTACIAHADLGHLLSNLVFLVVFGRLVGGYFGWLAFPVMPFFLGGIVNLLVLPTYAEDISILGASGVVNIVGGMWLALFFMISRQYRLSGRLLRTGGVAMLLFAPQEFRPHIADRVHLAGLLVGIISGFCWFGFHRQLMRSVEVWEDEMPEVTENGTPEETNE